MRFNKLLDCYSGRILLPRAIRQSFNSLNDGRIPVSLRLRLLNGNRWHMISADAGAGERDASWEC